MTLSGAPDVAWHWRRFEELSREELYAVLRLRQQVFVVEQNCVWLDVDGRDDRAWHLIGRVRLDDDDLLGAYARVLPAGVKYAEASIGRIVTHPELRRAGLGRALMREALTRTEEELPGGPIRMQAQLYLEEFYRGYGFRTTSPEPYDDAGVLHVDMVRDGGG